MGSIRVQRITEYLCTPLQKCLKDSDAYVRKTAAVCVAKLFDINPQLVVEQGFLDSLRDLLSDSNPMVVSNAVAALSEIDEASKTDAVSFNPQNVQKLQAALNECTEWGQVFILSALAKYVPRDSREAETIAERVSPRLQHANSAVVLSSIKVLMKYMDIIQNPEVVRSLSKKMAPPLVTLLSKESETQYVALRNINLIIQKRENILQHEMKVFFCKYNDPIYVKMEKLEIMIMLASERNIQQVVVELKEYAQEVDVEFVRKAVRAIGRCAIKLDFAAEMCVQALVELIQTKVNYVVQEAIIVIKDIFRKYPNKYESIIATLCENLESLDEPEAKASMIWIIGEYAERIDNADELLETFLETFKDESSGVQLQLLTATVKLFLKRPKDTQKLVQLALRLATAETDNPDLRDRGFVYWRLLARDPEAAKAVVLSEKPTVTDSTSTLEPSLLNELINNISTLSSVFHKPPDTFVSKLRSLNDVKPLKGNAINEEESFIQDEEGAETGGAPPPSNLLDLSDLGPALPSADHQHQYASQYPGQPTSPLQPQPQYQQQFAGQQPPVQPVVNQYNPSEAPRIVLLSVDKGKGLLITGNFKRRNGIFLDMTLSNQSPQPMSGFAIQFNKNSFGLAPAATGLQIQSIMPGQSADYSLALIINQQQILSLGSPSNIVQVAFKNNVEIFYFQTEIPLHVFFTEDGRLEREPYIEAWKQIQEEYERMLGIRTTDVDFIQSKLVAHNLFFTARRQVADQYGQMQFVLYLSLKTVLGTAMLVELTVAPQSFSARCCVKTKNPELVSLFLDWIEMTLSS
eukprot:TRINITY_DN3217_c0_g2_i1.p1 TRINITY_DN3217_c0_g2~~TRINITY_DN3217_c0_g2_i1.p1  ORF type:complete len:805 (-),score=219.13 TRINITY_DN3217_c0_g2_i1:340-2754(-)